MEDGFAFLRKSHGRANSPPDCLLGPAFRIRPPNTQTQKKTNPIGLVFFWWGRTDSFAFSSGVKKIKVLPPSSWRQATVHWTVAFEYSNPYLCKKQNSYLVLSLGTDWLFCGKATAGQTVHRTVCLDRPFESALRIPKRRKRPIR